MDFEHYKRVQTASIMGPTAAAVASFLFVPELSVLMCILAVVIPIIVAVRQWEDKLKEWGKLGIEKAKAMIGDMPNLNLPNMSKKDESS